MATSRQLGQAKPGGQGHGFDYAEVFKATASPALILDLDLIIRDANPAYLHTTDRRREDLLGLHIFEAFPANPDDPEDDGAENLRRSLGKVMETGQRDSMSIVRYDVASAPPARQRRVRYWNPVNSPIFDADGELVGILHTVEDVTPFRDDLLQALALYRSGFAGDHDSAPSDPELSRRFVHYVTAAMNGAKTQAELLTKVEQLNRAMDSRATIEQAKGIVMAHRGCDRNEAFKLLRQISQTRNIKLRDVAAALVERAERAERSPAAPFGGYGRQAQQRSASS